MGRTLGIHWSQTTYGNWPPGDKRGSWFAGRRLGPDPFLEAAARAAMNCNAVVLSSRERQLVADAVGSTVLQEGYRVLAATIQPVHFHLLFTPLRVDVKRVIAQLKYRSAHVVLGDRDNHNLPRSRCLWTTGRFPVYVFTEKHLLNVIECIRDHNRRLGLPADPFDWIDPLYPPSEIRGERFSNMASEAAPFW
jgi:REP element-mobilizing transposase RayT